MAWAKLDTDVLGDPKLMRASRKGARNLALWPWLIAFAKQANDDGRLSVGGEPAEPEDISSLIPGAKPRDVTVCCIHLEEIGVLARDADGAYRISKWQKRQDRYASDAPEAVAERVRRHREKSRSNGNGHEHETTDVTTGNESVKRPPLAREEKRREKKRKETEQNVVTPDAFEEAWQAYPQRVGTNSKRDARKAWDARLAEDVPAADMLAGVRRYRAFVDGGGVGDPKYVMAASRFFGPSRHFDDPWAPADPMPPMYGDDGTTYTPEWLAWNARQTHPVWGAR